MRAENIEVSYGPGLRGVSGLRCVAYLFLMFTAAACTTTGGKIAAAPWDTPKGWGLDGYDPVAYFTDQKPMLGDPKYAYEAQGVRWKFASLEHQRMFIADPRRYEPQFGGYCAYAVSLNTTAHGDPHQWAIVNDKLYVNANVIAAHLWSLDRSGNIDKGNKNWPNILKGTDEDKPQ
ncbi:MAG: YHS domain-containing (seleno)protein [Steroidobacteraceae bacterium]